MDRSATPLGSPMIAYLRRFLPQPVAQPLPERLKAFAGALIGIAVTGLVTHLAVRDAGALPLLIAPMGASAVLLFAVPASPLAQPWSIIGGNIISGLAGVTCVKLIADPTLAAGAAVASAIALMTLARCLHPPGGAVALTCAVGGPAVEAAGYGFVLMPVALNSFLLLAAALIFNNLSGRSYPHVAHALPPAPHGAADPPPDARVGFTLADIDEALRRYGELLDVSREDLDALFRQVEVQAFRRLHGEIRCADIMSRHVVSLSPGDSQAQARDLLAGHDFRSAPVLDADGRLLGLITRAILLGAGEGPVEAVMDHHPPTAGPDTPIDDLLPVLSHGEWREVMILDGDRRMAGIVTQTDLIAALYRARVAEAVAAAPA
ncbi:MAG TPA: HPP family protein [Caulobacter sp.]|nr:HPP family protein [Caulobacter sp.]